jgi:hypothetical protein
MPCVADGVGIQKDHLSGRSGINQSVKVACAVAGQRR